MGIEENLAPSGAVTHQESASSFPSHSPVCLTGTEEEEDGSARITCVHTHADCCCNRASCLLMPAEETHIAALALANKKMHTEVSRQNREAEARDGLDGYYATPADLPRVTLAEILEGLEERVNGNPDGTEMQRQVLSAGQCCVCGRVAQKPATCFQGHVICKRTCLREWVRTAKSCPVCRGAMDATLCASPLALDNLLSDKSIFGVRCPHKGCDEIVHPFHLEEHALKCRHRMLVCPASDPDCPGRPRGVSPAEHLRICHGHISKRAGSTSNRECLSPVEGLAATAKAGNDGNGRRREGGWGTKAGRGLYFLEKRSWTPEGMVGLRLGRFSPTDPPFCSGSGMGRCIATLVQKGDKGTLWFFHAVVSVCNRTHKMALMLVSLSGNPGLAPENAGYMLQVSGPFSVERHRFAPLTSAFEGAIPVAGVDHMQPILKDPVTNTCGRIPIVSLREHMHTGFPCTVEILSQAPQSGLLWGATHAPGPVGAATAPGKQETAPMYRGKRPRQ